MAIGLRDADWLSEQIQKDKISVQMKTNGHFLPDTIGHNVIGELTGSEFPDEIITIGGHLDHWDPAEGAHDDGAGCVQTIEILRAFKALVISQNERSVLFYLPMKKMVCVVVINMQKKQKQKMRNTFLLWKVMLVDLHQEVLVLADD